MLPNHIWARHLLERSDQDTPLYLEEPRDCRRAPVGAWSRAVPPVAAARPRFRPACLGGSDRGWGIGLPLLDAGTRSECRSVAARDLPQSSSSDRERLTSAGSQDPCNQGEEGLGAQGLGFKARSSHPPDWQFGEPGPLQPG